MTALSSGNAAQRIYQEQQIFTAPFPELAVLIHAGAASSLRRARNEDGRYSGVEVRAQLFRARSLLYLLKDSLVLQEGPVARKLYQVYDQLVTILEDDESLDTAQFDFTLEVMSTLQKSFEGVKKRAVMSGQRRML